MLYEKRKKEKKKGSKDMIYFCLRLIKENESISFVICEYWHAWSIKGEES